MVGTRPEAIKMGMVIRALMARPWAEVCVITTGQHGPVVDETLALFGVRATHSAGPPGALRQAPPRTCDGLPGLTAGLLTGLAGRFAATRPDLVLVQGDTTSALAGAMAAYLAQIKVAHVEAGLRSYGPLPFPEEANRRLIAPLADLHLAPTPEARDNLLAERTPPARVVVTGNTVIDALMHVAAGMPEAAGTGRPLVVVTAHRRESWGEPMRRIARVVADLAGARPELDLLVATHLNPRVQAVFHEAVRDLPNVVCAPPLPYPEFVAVLGRAALVITDSGGVQEEAACLRLPLLVMRETTERPEVLDSPWVHLVGTDEELILKTATAVLDEVEAPRVRLPRPCVFGDGKAAERIAAACGSLFGLNAPMGDFHPPG
ncbi:MAG: UDP-N-acetylglucosamine 2-epimerase (non-hydrolyzing) [Thermoactinospora sp.]|nr:UDP-N-acetylglucosamine 2-epimerase (non-hydrolyzing) [Thermoactinospora sp.]